MTITRGAEKIFRRTRMLFIINVRQQWGLDYFLLFIINARSQMKKTRLFAGKCEMPGLKMHLSAWFWLAAEMSKNFDRPMRSWGYHCLADRIAATPFHTTVSCDISVKDFLLIKWICTIWPCVLKITIITSLFSGIVILSRSARVQMMLLGSQTNYMPSKSHVTALSSHTFSLSTRK